MSLSRPFSHCCVRGCFAASGDLDGADDLGDVVAVDGCGGGDVEACEDAVEVGWASCRGDLAQAVAEAGLLRWCGEEAVDEGAKVEAGASGDDGEVAALSDAAKGFASLAAVVAGGAGLIGPGDVDHVVLNEGALFVRGLGGADLHLAVDGYGVAADDLAVELLGQPDGEGGFAAGGGAGEDDQRLVFLVFRVRRGRVHHRRHHPGVKTLWRPVRRRLKQRMARASRRRPRIWRRRSCCLAWDASTGEGMCLLRSFIDEIVDAEFEVGAVELAGERRELPYAGDGAPRGAIDGLVLRGAVEVHGADASIGQDGEADQSLALLVERGTGLLGDEGEPRVVDLADDLFEVGIEVDAHGVGEDVDAGVHALVGDGDAGAVVSASAAILGGCLGCLADGVACALRLAAEVRARGGGLGGVDDRLLLGWVLRQRLGRGLLRGLWSCLLWRLRCRGARCCSGGTGFAHGLELLEGLPVEGRLGGLLGAILVAHDIGRASWGAVCLCPWGHRGR